MKVLDMLIKTFMQLAINKAREGKIPFAACIVKNNRVIACEYSKVFPNNDPTAHGEVQAIRAACKKLKAPDLPGCILYTTCQPCAMCLVACYWARIDSVVYGATLVDSNRAGWRELDISGKLAKRIVGNKVKLTGRIMQKECAAILKEFRL
ncbi:guanine deaminase [mine drainage metagenome]|uniref:Guanine deaminase n=1 Tax=mine drainage metagenome TaxID=410659 RepID=T1AI30_9ZZZZ